MEENVMKMKRFLALTLACIMTAGILTGCGGKQGTTDQPPANTPADTAPTETTEIVKKSPMLSEMVDAVGDYPTFKAGESAGNYTVCASLQPNWTVCSVELNQSYKDEQYAELFSLVDFRHALSIAVDRNELNEILYAGLAEPAQAAAPQSTAHFV